MEQHAPISKKAGEAVFRNMPPAANQDLASDKELHELWLDKYLRKSRKQEKVTLKAHTGRK